MTSSEMLTKVRTLLDEDSAGFWSDNQIYNALAEGQREVINILLALYRAQKQNDYAAPIPEPLRSLIATKSTDPIAAGAGIVVPDDYLEVIEIWYNSSGGVEAVTYVVDKQNAATNFLENNSYMSGDTDIAYLGYNKDKSQKEFSFSTISSGSAKGTLVYLAMPSDIASGTQPALPTETHSAIVQYAYSDIARRDKILKSQAPNEYEKFLNMVREL